MTLKKSKLISIGLLAAAISSCGEDKKTNNDWNVPNSYVSTDSGATYHHSHSGAPIWFYMWMMNSNGRYHYSPAVGYRGRTMHSGGAWRVSSAGHSYAHASTSHGGSHSFSRGGFGGSSHFSSAS